MKIEASDWEPDFEQGLRAIPEHLSEQQLVTTPSWRGFKPERRPRNERELQLMLMYSGAGAFEPGLRRALELGAVPGLPVLKRLGDHKYEEEAVFWWSCRPDGSKDELLHRVVFPLECAVAGADSDCIRLILEKTGSDSFAEVFAWLMRQRQNSWRIRSSLSLFEAARELPAGEKYSGAVLERIRQFEHLYEGYEDADVWQELRSTTNRTRQEYEQIQKRHSRKNGN